MQLRAEVNYYIYLDVSDTMFFSFNTIYRTVICNTFFFCNFDENWISELTNYMFVVLMK